jgi:hypothetical protein
MTRRLALVLGAAAVVLAAGCGGDDDDDDAGGGGGDVEVSDDAQPYVDAMIESFDNSDPDELQIDREQAQCLAPRWVETIGPERLADAGIEPEDFAAEGEVELSEIGLSEDDGNALYDAFAECDIDVRTLLVESIAADEELSDEDAACLGDAFSDDLVRRLMIRGLLEEDEDLDADDELTGELLAAFSECPGAVDIDGN